MIDFIASLAGQPETYRVRLRMMIDEHFDKNELQTLCFDMVGHLFQSLLHRAFAGEL